MKPVIWCASLCALVLCCCQDNTTQDPATPAAPPAPEVTPAQEQQPQQQAQSVAQDKGKAAREVLTTGLPAITNKEGDAQRSRALNKQGLEAHKAREYDKAAALFKQAVQADPGFILARYNLACAWNLSGEAARAIAVLAELKQAACPLCIKQLQFAPQDKDFASVWKHEDFVAVTTVDKAQLRRGGAEGAADALEAAFRGGDPGLVSLWWPDSGKIQFGERSSLLDEQERPASTTVKAVEAQIKNTRVYMRNGEVAFHGCVRRECKARCCVSRHTTFHHGGQYLDELCVNEEGSIVRLIVRGE